MCLPLRHFKRRWCVEEVGVWFLSYAIWLYSRKNFKSFDFCWKGPMSFVCCPFSVLSTDWFCGFRLISQCLVWFLNWIATKFKKKKKLLWLYHCRAVLLMNAHTFPYGGRIPFQWLALYICSILITCICLLPSGWTVCFAWHLPPLSLRPFVRCCINGK